MKRDEIIERVIVMHPEFEHDPYKLNKILDEIEDMSRSNYSFYQKVQKYLEGGYLPSDQVAGYTAEQLKQEFSSLEQNDLMALFALEHLSRSPEEAKQFLAEGYARKRLQL